MVPSSSDDPLSCASGKACFDAGAANYDGAEPTDDATDADLALATRHFIRACELGYDRGCHVSGNMFRLGIGVEKDLRRAREYYESVCDEATYPEACHNLHLTDRELSGQSGR